MAVYLSRDKSPKQVQTEILTKRLLAILENVKLDGQLHGLKSDEWSR